MLLVPFETPEARKARELAAEILALKQEREATTAPGPVPFGGGPVAAPTPFGGSLAADVAPESRTAALQRFRTGEQAPQPSISRPGPRTVPQRLGYWKPEDVNDEEWNTALRREFERRGLPANTGLPVGSPLTSINEALADILYQRGDEEAIKAAQAQARATLALPVEMVKGMTKGVRATRLPGTDVYPFGGNKEMAERVAEEYSAEAYRRMPLAEQLAWGTPGLGPTAGMAGVFVGPAARAAGVQAGVAARTAVQAARKAAPVMKQLAVGERGGILVGPGAAPKPRKLTRAESVNLADMRKRVTEGRLPQRELKTLERLEAQQKAWIDAAGQKPLAEAAPAAKAWQVPRQQYLDEARRFRIENGPVLKPPAMEAELRGVANAHRKAVVQAVEDGQPVPAEVLRDYPDLAPVAKPQAPAAVPMRELPSLPLADNYRKPLSEYTDSLYRETNARGALDFTDPHLYVDMSGDRPYFANTANLALGQKGNKGVLLELDAAMIEGQVNRSKPGWEFAWKNGEAEFWGLNATSAYRSAVRSLTLKPEAAVDRAGLIRIKGAMQEMGWSVSQNADGSTTYIRPPAAKPQAPAPETLTRGASTKPAGVAKPLSPSAQTPAQAPVSVPRAVTPATPPQPAAAPQAATGAGAAPPTGATPPGGGVPPSVGGAIPPAAPIAPRPRTLVDLNREAKGMRALTPEQRAAVMDVAEPITGDIIYQAKPFNEHAQNLLGPDTPFMRALRRLPGVKQAFGAWNPAQMARESPVAMIGLRQAIFQEVEKGRARFAVLRWWHDADDAFGFKQTGTAFGLKPGRGFWRATKVQPAPGAVKGKMFGTINDLIEHSDRYVLNEEQLRVLQLADSTLTQSVRDAQRAGVDVVELAEAYWPRSVIKGPKDVKGFGAAKRRIASSKGYTHQRAFSDVDDLVAAGYEVETEPRRVFASRLEAGIDTIAHQNSRKQIAALPGVEKPLERMAARYPATLKTAADARTARDAAKAVVVKAGAQATPADVIALRQAEADYITAMRDVFARKIEAGAPGYYELRLPNGRIAPQELVEEIGKAIELPELQRTGGGAASVVREVSQLLRTTLTNVDLAAGYIQGQSLFYRNNVAWWKAQAHALISLVDDPTAYVAKNADMIDEGVRAGAIVPPTEFLFAKQGLASIPLRVPVAGPALRSFNRAFEWFITVGQTELYKAARQGPMKNAGMEDLVSLGSAIRKQVGTESYAILGVRHNQQTVEALSLFAARFFRANVGILGQSFTAGPGGASARAAVGSLIAGGAALTVGVSWAQNKKLPNMTDPYMPDWMQVKFGDSYYNFFGPLYGYFRTLARMGVAGLEGDPIRAAKEAKQFLTSKESLPLRAIDIAGQLTYYGQANVYGTKIEKTPVSIAKGMLTEFVEPIALQETVPALLAGEYERAIEIAGMQARPESIGAATNRIFEKAFPSLRKLDISLGYVPKKVDLIPDFQGGEVELTPQQRDKYQKMTAALVIDSLTKNPSPMVKAYLSMPDEKRKRLTPGATERVKEAMQRQIDKAKDSARNQFRAWLQRQGVKPPERELIGAGAR